MKMSFIPPNDEYAEYCFSCNSKNTLIKSTDDKGIIYNCEACGAECRRALIIDPDIKWSIDDNKEYVHESVGVFIVNDKSEFLVFKLSKYPFGYTIPAGHVNASEAPISALKREAYEETSLEISSIKLFYEGVINNDSCRRGSDVHMWHAYTAVARDISQIKIDKSEGANPCWVSYDELLKLQLAPAIRHLVNYVDK